MNRSEPCEKPHLSASSVSAYIDCGLSYKFSKIDKLPMEFTPDSMVFGTVIHHALECYYFEKKFGKVLSLRQVHEAFQEFWTMEVKKHDEIQYSNGKDYQSYILEGKELLSAWYNQLPDDNFQVIGVEERFSFEIPGLPIEIIGYIDLLEADESGTLIITDFKTAAKSYSAAEIDKNMQLLIYQLAMKSGEYADREILLRLDCLIKTKTPKFAQHYTVRGEADEKRVIKKIKQVWDGISKQVFIPNDLSWKCNNCSYKNACNDWFLNEGGES